MTSWRLLLLVSTGFECKHSSEASKERSRASRRVEPSLTRLSFDSTVPSDSGPLKPILESPFWRKCLGRESFSRLFRELVDSRLTSRLSSVFLPKATSSRRSSGLGSTVFESTWISTLFLGLKTDGVSTIDVLLRITFSTTRPDLLGSPPFFQTTLVDTVSPRSTSCEDKYVSAALPVLSVRLTFLCGRTDGNRQRSTYAQLHPNSHRVHLSASVLGCRSDVRNLERAFHSRCQRWADGIFVSLPFSKRSSSLEVVI